jgi:hypothetical protein
MDIDLGDWDDMDDELTSYDVMDSDEEVMECCGGIGCCVKGCGEVDSKLDFFSR